MDLSTGDALANPAVYQEDDGTIFFAYRGRHDEVLPIASAPHWSGPFTRIHPAGASAYLLRGSSWRPSTICGSITCIWHF